MMRNHRVEEGPVADERLVADEGKTAGQHDGQGDMGDQVVFRSAYIFGMVASIGIPIGAAMTMAM